MLFVPEVHSSNKYCVSVYGLILLWFSPFLGAMQIARTSYGNMSGWLGACCMSQPVLYQND